MWSNTFPFAFWSINVLFVCKALFLFCFNGPFDWLSFKSMCLCLARTAIKSRLDGDFMSQDPPRPCLCLIVFDIHKQQSSSTALCNQVVCHSLLPLFLRSWSVETREQTWGRYAAVRATARQVSALGFSQWCHTVLQIICQRMKLVCCKTARENKWAVDLSGNCDKYVL